MKFINKGFSLIEVIIATSIITITVFGVYRLIGENTKIISNSSNYLQMNSLFPIIEECIENTVSTFPYSPSPTYFYLENNLSICQIVASKSGVIIDNLEYALSAKNISTSPKYNDWEIFIELDSIKTQTGYYKQVKK